MPLPGALNKLKKKSPFGAFLAAVLPQGHPTDQRVSPREISQSMTSSVSDTTMNTSGSQSAREPPAFSLAAIRAEIAKVAASGERQEWDVATIQRNLGTLYLQEHALVEAVTEASEASGGNGSATEKSGADSTLPHFDCTLEELQGVVREVRAEIEKWLDALSAGPPEIDYTQIHYSEADDLIGEGAYGRVYKGTLQGTKVAVKVPAYQLDSAAPSELEDFRKEIKILRKIFHPNVVLVLGACTKPGKIRIVFELMKMSMKTLVTDARHRYKQDYALKRRLKLATDVAKGLAWLHSDAVKIIHRDLKLDNIMVDAHDNAKVADFGLSMLRQESTVRDNIRGNLLYRAPELMLHSRGKARKVEFSDKIDVYAFAILMWEIANGTEWYPPPPHDEPSTYLDYIVGGNRPPLPKKWPEVLCSLVSVCWGENPDERPSMAEVVDGLQKIEFEHWKLEVAAAIKSELGREFWINHFTELEVPYHTFIYVLSRQVRLKLAKFGPLKMLLCADWESPQPEKNVRATVSVKEFNVVQSVWGPFFVREHAHRICEEMSKVVGKDWFHGYISRGTAEERLKITYREAGTFLVRMSVSQETVPFVVSYVSDAGKGGSRRAAHHHVKIARKRWDAPTLTMDGEEFQSVLECVTRGKEKGILLTACPSDVPVSAYDEKLT